MTSGNQPYNWKTWISLSLSLILPLIGGSMLMPLQALAQTDIPVKTYLSNSYYEEDGLASNQVFEMEQSTDGLLWFATQKGISTFDGLRWNTFNYEISPNSADHIFFLPLQNGSMLFGGVTSRQIQIACHRNGQWKPIALPEEIKIAENEHFLRGTRISATQHLPDQFLVSLIRNQALYLYNSVDSVWNKYPVPPEIDQERMGRMLFYENKLIFFSTNGVAEFDLSRQEFKLNPFAEIADKSVMDATTSPDGKELYMLGDNFIARYNGVDCEILLDRIHEEAPEIPFYLVFRNILADSQQRLFFNYNYMMFKYNIRTQKLEQVKLDNEKAEFTPSDIFEDREGNIWFTNLRGVKKVSSFRFHNINNGDPFSSTEISTILPLDADRVLLGGNKGIKLFAHHQLRWQQTFKPQSSIHFTRVLDAIKTPQGEVFMAANSLGLGQLMPDESLQWIPMPENQLATALAWHQDSLLVATNRGSLYYFNTSSRKLERIWFNHKLYIRKIVSLDDQLLLLSNNGLYQIKGNKSRCIKSQNLQQQNLFSYLQWKGRALLGSTGGLCELIGGEIVKINEDSLRLDRPVYAMLEDAKGRLWAGTDKGVYIYEQQGFVNYGPQQGLSGKEINRAAFQPMPDGSIWIGTDQGLSVYNPDDDFTPAITPKIRITSLIAQGNELNTTETHKLNFKNNNLVFQFQAISFYQPGENNFRYKLEGLEEEWMYSDNHLINQVRYTNLPSGTYHFVIQARNGNGEWSPEARSSQVYIRQPFYKSWWFILSILTVISSLGYMAHALISNKANERRLREAINIKKAEVERSEKRFRAVWEGTDTCFVLLSREGKIRMANPSFCKLFNISEQQACASALSSLIPDPGFEKQNLQKIYDQKTIYRSQVLATLPLQTYYLLATITFVDQAREHEPLMIVSFKDFTDQKQAENNNLKLNTELTRQNMALLKKEDELANYNHELLQHREELEQALRAVEERNFQLDQFVYKTSHDLRAPIASALGLINIIKLDNDYKRWPEYLQHVEVALKRQDRFIKAMLSFSKSTRSKNKAEGIDFNELISQCLQELQGLPDYREVEQHVQLSSQGMAFFSDKMKLHIILSNVISNAIKYRDPFKKSFLQIQVRISSVAAEIVINDNGIGIPAQYMNQIFDMFFRATERSDGSGLGLYIVKQTIEKLRGQIIAESEQGKGTSFRLYIPNQHPISGISGHDSDMLIDREDNTAINSSAIS